MKSLCVAVMLMIVSLTFFACNSAPLPEFSCSGVISISNVGLQGVSIKSNLREYVSTDFNGAYSFKTNAKELTIIPQKEGYIFEPAKAVLKEGENTANFVAIKIENLTGTLVLSKVIITPTSILSSVDNYQYLKDGALSLKASDIKIKYNGEGLNIISNPTYLKKSQRNTISVPSGISVNCGTINTIGILINTYFLRYNSEWHTSDTEYINLYITKPQTNADLVDGKITYNMYGINNKSKSFTFDVAFVFKYIES